MIHRRINPSAARRILSRSNWDCRPGYPSPTVCMCRQEWTTPGTNRLLPIPTSASRNNWLIIWVFRCGWIGFSRREGCSKPTWAAVWKARFAWGHPSAERRSRRTEPFPGQPSTSTKDGFNLSLQGAGGIQMNVTKRLGIYVEPQVMWRIPTGDSTLETYRSTHPLMFSAATGVRCTIGK